MTARRGRPTLAYTEGRQAACAAPRWPAPGCRPALVLQDGRRQRAEVCQSQGAPEPAAARTLEPGAGTGCTHPGRPAQERNQAKAAAAGKGSQLKSNAAAQSIVCQVCRSSFLCTSSYAKLVEHADSKHPGKGARCRARLADPHSPQAPALAGLSSAAAWVVQAQNVLPWQAAGCATAAEAARHHLTCAGMCRHGDLLPWQAAGGAIATEVAGSAWAQLQL